MSDDLGYNQDWDRLAFGFMLVLARTAGAVTALPGLGEAAAPARLRAALALCLTALLLPGLLAALPPTPDTGARAGLMVVTEVVAGLWFGWMARLPMLALPMAGQLIAAFMGLSNVLQTGADMGPQTTALARLFEIAAPMLILATGAYALPLAALRALYDVIPAGGPLSAGDMGPAFVQTAATSLALALSLAAPFVVAGLVWQTATGLMARFLPRLQI